MPLPPTISYPPKILMLYLLFNSVFMSFFYESLIHSIVVSYDSVFILYWMLIIA